MTHLNNASTNITRSSTLPVLRQPTASGSGSGSTWTAQRFPRRCVFATFGALPPRRGLENMHSEYLNWTQTHCCTETGQHCVPVSPLTSCSRFWLNGFQARSSLHFHGMTLKLHSGRGIKPFMKMIQSKQVDASIAKKINKKITWHTLLELLKVFLSPLCQSWREFIEGDNACILQYQLDSACTLVDCLDVLG